MTKFTRRRGRSTPSESSLQPADHLDQATFHRLYEATDPDFRAELVGGVVHLPPKIGIEHSDGCVRLIKWTGDYVAKTPGVKLSIHPTLILGQDAEPQPDLVLRLPGFPTWTPDYGSTEYLAGPPPLVIEVAHTHDEIDLHAKRRDYERYGVGEYLVYLVRSLEVLRFVRDADRFVELKPSGRVLKSRIFPGLWLDPAALLRGDTRRMQAALNRGLASPEHAEFAASLGKAKNPGRKRR